VKVKICSYPTCKVLLPVNGPSRCTKHQFKPFSGAIRFNTHLYQTSKWKELRARIISKYNGMCVYCGKPANEVHHVVPPKGVEELFYLESNLVLLCKACHSRETALENRTTIGM